MFHECRPLVLLSASSGLEWLCPATSGTPYGPAVPSVLTICVLQVGPGTQRGHTAIVCWSPVLNWSLTAVSDPQPLSYTAHPEHSEMGVGVDVIRGFSFLVPVHPPCRVSSRMAPSTSTSTSPRVASTQTLGKKRCTAGSPQSTCLGVSSCPPWGLAGVARLDSHVSCLSLDTHGQAGEESAESRWRKGLWRGRSWCSQKGSAGSAVHSAGPGRPEGPE